MREKHTAHFTDTSITFYYNLLSSMNLKALGVEMNNKVLHVLYTSLTLLKSFISASSTVVFTTENKEFTLSENLLCLNL